MVTLGANEACAVAGGQHRSAARSAAEAFWQKVGTNFREGLLRLIFVADEIPASLQRLVGVRAACFSSAPFGALEA